MENIIKDKNVDKHDIKPIDFLKNNLEDNDKEVAIEDVKPIVVKDEVEFENKTNQIYETILKRTEEVSQNLANTQKEIAKREETFNEKLKEAEQRSYENGKQDAINEESSRVKSEHEESLKLYKESIYKIDEFNKNFSIELEQLKDELSKVALNIASKVIESEISENSSNIAKNLADKLINEVIKANKITLNLSPNDYSNLKNEFSKIDNLSIKDDPSIKDGGVIIKSDLGTIDGTIFSRYNKFINKVGMST